MYILQAIPMDKPKTLKMEFHLYLIKIPDSYFKIILFHRRDIFISRIKTSYMPE